MELSGRHQGGPKNWGERQAGTGVWGVGGASGVELPESISYFSERANKEGSYKWVRAKQG